MKIGRGEGRTGKSAQNKKERGKHMLDKIMEVSTGVCVLWGLGILGILLKMVASAYMKGLVRGSRDLGTARKRKLRTMRQQYENKRSFGLCGGDEEAYAESFVRSLRFLTRPMEFWDRSGRVFSLLTCGAMAAGFLYYDVSWRGSPDMQFFLINGFLVCVCLITFENIVLIKNQLEVLKANIRCYLERLPKARDSTEMHRPVVQLYDERDMESESAAAEQTVDNAADKKLVDSTTDKIPGDNVTDKKPAGDDEALNRFLAEFFS